MELTWTDNADDETGYVVERKVGNEPYAQLSPTLPPDAAAFTDSDVRAGTRDSYRVKAVNEAGSSGYSDVVTVTPAATPATRP